MSTVEPDLDVPGTVLHRDSPGSEQLIRPGQLNLMTALDPVRLARKAR